MRCNNCFLCSSKFGLQCYPEILTGGWEFSNNIILENNFLKSRTDSWNVDNVYRKHLYLPSFRTCLLETKNSLIVNKQPDRPSFKWIYSIWANLPRGALGDGDFPGAAIVVLQAGTRSRRSGSREIWMKIKHKFKFKFNKLIFHVYSNLFYSYSFIRKIKKFKNV